MPSALPGSQGILPFLPLGAEWSVISLEERSDFYYENRVLKKAELLSPQGGSSGVSLGVRGGPFTMYPEGSEPVVQEHFNF